MRTVLLMCLGLAACGSTGPQRTISESYAQLPWAKTGVVQAYHECMAEVQRSMFLAHSVCMRAKGWQERQ